MKKLILVLLLSLTCYGKYIEGEANFLSDNGDSLSFIKKQLLSNAFKKVIDQEIKEMGLDSVTFWSNYNAKFDEYFLSIKNVVEQKYIDTEKNEVPEEKREEYERVLRRKRLVAKSKYGRLNSAIKSYSIKKLSKSVTMPNSHYVNVNAKVNRRVLTDIYYKFIGITSIRTFRKLYLDVNYKLENTNWLELGVESQKDFVDVVNGHWTGKLNGSLREIFSDGIEIISDSDRARVNERLKKSNVALSAIDITNQGEEELELSNSLLMSIDVTIRKDEMNEGLKTISLSFAGGMVVTDLKDNSIVTYLDFLKEKTKFDIIETHILSSNIASVVYRLPMSKIQKMRKIVEENIKLKQSFELLIKGTKNSDEVYSFIKLLKEKGLLYYFSAKLVSFINDEARLVVNYSGNKEKALEVLNKLVTNKISEYREIEKDGVLPFVFNIKSLPMQDTEKEVIKKEEV